MSDATPTESTSRIAQVAGALAAASMANVALGIFGIRFGFFAPLTGFYLFVVGAILGGGVSFLIGAIAVFHTNGGRDPVGARRAWTGAIGGFVLLMAVILAGSGGSDVPVINDITTDLDDPPSFSAALQQQANQGRDMSYPEEFVPLVRDGYGDLESFRFKASQQDAYVAALDSAKRLGWTLTFEDPLAGLFEAQQSSPIFRFVDDIVVRVETEGELAVVDIRSKSRDGRSDMGANAARIRAFGAYLQHSNVAKR